MTTATITREPATSRVERSAYRAAHKIIMEITEHGQWALACPGARQSRRVDNIARIIIESMEDERV